MKIRSLDNSIRSSIKTLFAILLISGLLISCKNSFHKNESLEIKLAPIPFKINQPAGFEAFSDFKETSYKNKKVYISTSKNINGGTPITLLIGYYDEKKVNKQENVLKNQAEKLLGLWNINQKSIEWINLPGIELIMEIKSRQMASRESFESYFRFIYINGRVYFLGILAINPKASLWTMTMLKSFMASLEKK